MPISFKGCPEHLKTPPITPNMIKKWFEENEVGLFEAIDLKMEQELFRAGIVPEFLIPKSIAHRIKFLKHLKNNRIKNGRKLWLTNSQLKMRTHAIIADVLKCWQIYNPIIKTTIDDTKNQKVTVDVALPPIISERLMGTSFVLSGL